MRLLVSLSCLLAAVSSVKLELPERIKTDHTFFRTLFAATDSIIRTDPETTHFSFNCEGDFAGTQSCTSVETYFPLQFDAVMKSFGIDKQYFIDSLNMADYRHWKTPTSGKSGSRFYRK